MKKIILIIFLVVVFIFNLTPVSYLLKENYTYRNSDGSYTFQEEGGGYNFNMAKTRYKWFLREHPSKSQGDTQLYRTFEIKPWYIWEWGDYIFQHERFSLPYKAP
jgi:hypothetical protein